MSGEDIQEVLADNAVEGAVEQCVGDVLDGVSVAVLADGGGVWGDPVDSVKSW